MLKVYIYFLSFVVSVQSIYGEAEVQLGMSMESVQAIVENIKFLEETPIDVSKSFYVTPAFQRRARPFLFEQYLFRENKLILITEIINDDNAYELIHSITADLGAPMDVFKRSEVNMVGVSWPPIDNVVTFVSLRYDSQNSLLGGYTIQKISMDFWSYYKNSTLRFAAENNIDISLIKSQIFDLLAEGSRADIDSSNNKLLGNVFSSENVDAEKRTVLTDINNSLLQNSWTYIISIFILLVLMAIHRFMKE